MSRLPSITLVGVNLGGLPSYSDLYFKSAGANPEINFLIATDQEPPPSLPANIRIFKIDWAAFERLASDKLGRKMRLTSPKKLCDYKPAYGRIFCDELRRADYWGHIDFDIVWGNIPKYLHEPLAEGFQVISADGRRLSGPLTIYRNSHELRELFREIPDVYSKLNAFESFDLDERDFDSLVKSSGITLALRRFFTRRNVSPEELRDFLSDDVLYQRMVEGIARTEPKGARLPALWRSGEMWNCLPDAKPNQFRLLNCIFLHLTSARVKFTVDFANDLILPATA